MDDTTLILLLWIGLAVGVGWWANEWGRHPIYWTMIALALTPIIGAIGLIVKGRDEDVLDARRPYDPADDAIAHLDNLATLRDKGAISDEEYQSKKRELLERL